MRGADFVQKKAKQQTIVRMRLYGVDVPRAPIARGNVGLVSVFWPKSCVCCSGSPSGTHEVSSSFAINNQQAMSVKLAAPVCDSCEEHWKGTHLWGLASLCLFGVFTLVCIQLDVGFSLWMALLVCALVLLAILLGWRDFRDRKARLGPQCADVVPLDYSITPLTQRDLMPPPEPEIMALGLTPSKKKERSKVEHILKFSNSAYAHIFAAANTSLGEVRID
jgi:hypothetical protein